jgi:hypothetical protein
VRRHHGGCGAKVSITTGPTLAGFNVFIYQVMLIDPLNLPTDSAIIGYAYQNALNIVNPALAAIGCLPGAAWSLYASAVYNLGGSNIVNFAQDQQGRLFFAGMRKELGIGKFTPGVVAGSSDAGSADALLNPEFMKTMTMRDLRTLRDPWGRAYMEIVMDYGDIWALT